MISIALDRLHVGFDADRQFPRLSAALSDVEEQVTHDIHGRK